MSASGDRMTRRNSVGVRVGDVAIGGGAKAKVIEDKNTKAA